jgi:glutathione S-transferase
MAVKLHRCSNLWVKIQGHPCWRVQSALDKQGIEYEIVKGPLRRSQRDDIERLSGQRAYPVIEFEDGSVYRAESNEMAERIKAGKLFEQSQGDQGSPAVSQPTST